MDWRLFAFTLILWNGVSWHSDGPADQQLHPRVVSYLGSRDPKAYAPGLDPTPVIDRSPWEWHVYDPVSRHDTTFLKLRFPPVGIRWDSTFTWAYFINGDKVARVRWKLGAKVEDLFSLPADSAFCDFWADGEGLWHVVTQREVNQRVINGVLNEVIVGVRYDFDARSRAWRIGAVDSAAGGHYGECYVTPKLKNGAPQPRTIKIEDLLESMSINASKAIKISDDTHGSEADEWVWVPSDLDSTLGLEMGGGMGDSYHAFEPIVWVDRKRSLRKTVYSSRRPRLFEQVGFAESRGSVLIATEYDGQFPAIVDLRTGEVLLRVTQNSARAVWVPAPR